VFAPAIEAGVDGLEHFIALAAARGLIVTVRLIDEGGPPLPKSFHVEMVYVIQGDQIWQTSEIEQGRNQSEFVIRKGPQWEPRSFVDIFLRITDGKGAPFLLVVKFQTIDVAS
jgi:hypothetical protein